MKQIKSLLFLFLMLLLIASCKKNEYINVIPKDASLVARIELDNIYEESDFQHTTIFGASSLYTGMFFDKEGAKKAQEYLTKPENFGIDFRNPIYLFNAGDYSGITMDVHSESKVEEFLSLLHNQNICTKLQDKDGIKTCTFLDEIAVALNDHTLLFLISRGEGTLGTTRQLANQLLNQDEELSFTSTQPFSDLEAMGEKDFSLYGNLAIIPKEIRESFFPFIPKTIKNSDIQLISSLDFTDGMATLTAALSGKTEEAQTLLKSTEENFCKIEGRYIGSPVEDFGIWATLGVKGAWMLDNLKKGTKSKQYITMIERAIDIEEMLRSVDGDLTVVLPSQNGDATQPYPDFMLTAKTSNTDFLSEVDYWTQSMKEYGVSMYKNGKNDYFLQAKDYSFYWGVDADNLYISSEQAFKHNAVTKRSTILSQYEDEIKRNNLFVYFNLQAMPLKSLRSIQLFGGNVHKMKSLIIKAPSTQEITIQLELKDRSGNFLKNML